MKTFLVVGFWLAVFLLIRFLWLFARRPPRVPASSRPLVRAADAFTRDAARTLSTAAIGMLAAFIAVVTFMLMIVS